jgi:hypothetical protein
MKKILYLFIGLFILQINAQTTPPLKTRSDGTFTQQDFYLNASKRFGIPTSSGDDIIANSPTQYKLLFNTTLGKLRLYDGSTWSDAFSGGSNQLNETYLNVYWSTKLSPINTNLTGYHIRNDSNILTGYTAYNYNNTDNAAISCFMAKGSGPDYTNSISIGHFNSNYYVPFLRDNGAVSSDKDMFLFTYGINKNIDFRTGSTFEGTTSKFKINYNGQLNIGIEPTVDNTVTKLLGWKSDGSVITVTSIPTTTPNFQVVTNTGATTTNAVTIQTINIRSDNTNSTQVGQSAGLSSSGYYQTAIGANAGQNNTGTFQSALGYSAGKGNTGANCAFFGMLAGFNNAADYVTSLGVGAGTGSGGVANTFSNTIHLAANSVGSSIATATHQLVINTNGSNIKLNTNVSGNRTYDFPIANAGTISLQNDITAAHQSLYERFGSGSPEGVVSAPVGASYHRIDGGAGTSFYVKESGGSTSSGWIAK